MATQEVPIEKQVTRWAAEDALSVGLPSVDSINLLVKITDRIRGTALCPASIGNNPANMLAVMLRGRELGMQPMESLQCMFVINNKIGMSYDAMLRHMRREGVKLNWKQNDDKGAEIWGETSDGYQATGRFTADDAKQAGLSGKETYQKYGRRMYAARAVSELYGKIGLGPRMYSPEELADLPPEEFTAETIADAAGVADAQQIDETVIRPEDQQNLMKTYEIYKLGPKAAAAKLLEIQAEVREKTDGNPEWAQQAINAEIARVMKESQQASVERGRRRRKPTASEQAAGGEPKVNGKAPEAAPEAESEPPGEDLGVRAEDAGPSQPAAQGNLGDDW